MLRSSSPTLSQLRAIDVTRIGQSVCESIHSRTRSAMSDWRMKRWRVARTSSLVLPEIADRGLIRSDGSSSRAQFSH